MASRDFRQKKSYWRINDYIRASRLRVISAEGKQIGVLTLEEALAQAKEAELDLVEIAPNANPPVAKIIDYTKFKYQQDKKDREAKLKERKGTEQKEIWLTPYMADNDYNVRLTRIREFLTDTNKVRVTIRFTGRQMGHKEFGYEMIERVKKDTTDIAKMDGTAKFLGRQLMMTLTPVKKQSSNNEKSESKQISPEENQSDENRQAAETP